MRILLVNWAKIWDGATNGGGVNGYAQSLALELVQRGHDVCYLSGGTTFTPDPRSGYETRPGPVEVRRHQDWLGVRVFEVVNSPVLAPSGYQFKEPLAEASSPELEAELARFVARLVPDAVHFHNIEGFSAGCVRSARSESSGNSRPAVLFSLHNYHTICPQVYLMHRHLEPCRDYDAGRACVGCIQAVDPDAERQRRVSEFAPGFASARAEHRSRAGATPVPPPPSPEPVGISALLAKLARRARRELGWEISQIEQPPPAPPPISLPEPPQTPGNPIASPEGVRASLPILGPDLRGQTPHLIAEQSSATMPKLDDPRWTPLDNSIQPQTEDRAAESEYARRRRAMVAALNSCDRVLAVSHFVRDKFVSMGVEPSHIEVNHIGTRVNRVVARFPDLVFDPPPFDPERPRPVRMVFMGYNNVYKGLPMLADALDLMSPEYLARIDLSIYAQAGESIEWRFRRLEPRLGKLTVGHGYQYFDIPWILGGKDLGLVTSIWWDNAPQTVFEFHSCGVPVLGANIGGIPDFIQDGHNGLLFRANDRYDLARRLAEVVRKPENLAVLRANVRPPKDIADHAAELENLYAACLPSHAPH